MYLVLNKLIYMIKATNSSVFTALPCGVRNSDLVLVFAMELRYPPSFLKLSNVPKTPGFSTFISKFEHLR
jgi:hypothetical protein